MMSNVIDFYGTGFNSANTSVLLKSADTTIFEGIVASVEQSDPTTLVRADYPIFFSYDYGNISGSVEFSLSVSEGHGFVFGPARSSFGTVYHAGLSPEQIESIGSLSLPDRIALHQSIAVEPFSIDELAVLNDPSVAFKPTKTILVTQHGANLLTTVDIRKNVLLGISVPDEIGMVGTFPCYQVLSGETLTFTIDIPAKS
jgi:hypothetical protein